MDATPDTWMARFKIVQGDITTQKVDAIVNAANSSLRGGGGVDGAIHHRAGPKLLAECRTLGGCETGEAKITGGYDLPARHVLHTVGPIWNGGESDEDAFLANCYRNCLRLAVEHGLRTIAFPSISTGAYSFPVERASRIAMREIRDYLKSESGVEKVIVVCYDRGTYDCYRDALMEVAEEENP